MTPERMEFGLPEEILRKLRDALGEFPAVDKAVIYGSRAKGTDRPGSDIDLALFGDRLTHRDLLRIETALDELNLPWFIDASLHHEIENPDLRAHIRRVGKTLFEKVEA